MADLLTPLSETPAADRLRALLAAIAKPTPVSAPSAARAPEGPQGPCR